VPRENALEMAFLIAGGSRWAATQAGAANRADAGPTASISAQDGAWTEINALDARSADEAIRGTVEREPENGGTFVAVPERSWRPRLVQVVQTTRLSFGDAETVGEELAPQGPNEGPNRSP
jgi:hypothetical protein